MVNVCMIVTNRGHDDPRVCMEAAALAADGRYQVTVLGWDRDADEDATLRQQGVTFCRLAVRSTHGRGLTQAWFLYKFWRRAAEMVRLLAPDVIHCHDFDTLPAGSSWARKLGAKLVFDAHENYPDMMMGHLPSSAVACLRRMEKRLLLGSDLLITVGSRLADHYRSLGAREVVVVGNWKNADAYRFAPRQVEDKRRELGLDGKIAVSFVANLGRECHLEPLMQAVAGDDRFACVIGGEGVLADLARQYSQKHANIKYLGHVNPSDVPLITAACDVIYYGFDCTNPNSRWSAPNKLYEAIAAGKPLLTGDFGEIGYTVRTSGCGVLAATETAAGVQAGLESLSDRRRLETMGASARQLQVQFSAAAAARVLVHAYGLLCPRDPLYVLQETRA